MPPPTGVLPHILSPPPRLAVAFGTPHAPILDEWRRAAHQHGVLLDLLYGAIAFGALADLKGLASGDPSRSTSLYVNCGGHEGLGISLRRYARAGLLREGERAEDALQEALAAAGVTLADDPFED